MMGRPRCHEWTRDGQAWGIRGDRLALLARSDWSFIKKDDETYRLWLGTAVRYSRGAFGSSGQV